MTNYHISFSRKVSQNIYICIHDYFYIILSYVYHMHNTDMINKISYDRILLSSHPYNMTLKIFHCLFELRRGTDERRVNNLWTSPFNKLTKRDTSNVQKTASIV